MISQHFGHQFTNDITQRDDSKIIEGLKLVSFRDKNNISVIKLAFGCMQCN